MVWHDGRVGNVDPVVVLAVNPTAVNFTIRVSPGQDYLIKVFFVFLPPKHILVEVPFEFCIVA